MIKEFFKLLFSTAEGRRKMLEQIKAERELNKVKNLAKGVIKDTVKGRISPNTERAGYIRKGKNTKFSVCAIGGIATQLHNEKDLKEYADTGSLLSTKVDSTIMNLDKIVDKETLCDAEHFFEMEKTGTYGTYSERAIPVAALNTTREQRFHIIMNQIAKTGHFSIDKVNLN